LIVNGEPAEPSKKAKVPANFDWQKLVREKQVELATEEADE
jgi:hypothetical protein